MILLARWTNTPHLMNTVTTQRSGLHVILLDPSEWNSLNFNDRKVMKLQVLGNATPTYDAPTGTRILEFPESKIIDVVVPCNSNKCIIRGDAICKEWGTELDLLEDYNLSQRRCQRMEALMAGHR